MDQASIAIRPVWLLLYLQTIADSVSVLCAAETESYASESMLPGPYAKLCCELLWMQIVSENKCEPRRRQS